MKVLLFTLEYPPFYGGVANYYGNIVKHWPQADGLFVLHNNDGKLFNNKLPFLKWLPAIRQLWRMIKKEKIEHVLVGHILPLGTAAYIMSRFTKTPYSVFLHGMELPLALKKTRKKCLAKKILLNAENIICSNGYTARMAKEAVGDKNAGKIKTVNPGVGINHISRITYHVSGILKEKHNLKDKIILLSVGRLVKRKGFDKVIESLPEVLKEIPNLVYVIIGSGSEENNLKLKDNVFIFNNVNNNERDAWLNISDIFIMPARDIGGDFEGFGIVYLEANLAGKPVIAGDSGGVRDAVIDGLNGLLVNPENVSDIAAAIIKLAKDENLRKKLGEQGRERAMKEFNWEKQVWEIYKIILSCHPELDSGSRSEPYR